MQMMTVNELLSESTGNFTTPLLVFEPSLCTISEGLRRNQEHTFCEDLHEFSNLKETRKLVAWSSCCNLM